MNNEIESKNSKNKFELEGNVGNIGTIYTNTNSKKMLRFDLCQNNNGNSQFIPIVLRGSIVETYGNNIQKGDWISVKGRISTYQKDVEIDGKIYKDKAIDILGFEITDKKNNKVYTSDGQIYELTDNKNKEMDR